MNGLLQNAAVVASALMISTNGARAADIDIPTLLPNLIGIGVGTTTEYSGGKEKVTLPAPGLRYVTEGGYLLEWYGPFGQLNLMNAPGWQLGPVLNVKMARKDVSDPVVKRIHETEYTLEAGMFVGYEYLKTDGIPLRLRVQGSVMTNGGDQYNGSRFTLSGSYWQPISQKFMLGIGVGGGWAPASYNNTYYGVTQQDSIASGLPVYVPGGGVHTGYAWIGAIYELTREWYVGALVLDQRLMNDAGRSPIVYARDQITAGVGLGFGWK
jgi:outer membrane scaffolding protein for murein synthesis (MipA/OmpV family)